MNDKNIIHEVQIKLRTALNYVLGLHNITDTQNEAINKIREAQELLGKVN
jgi:hypothetical protein